MSEVKREDRDLLSVKAWVRMIQWRSSSRC